MKAAAIFSDNMVLQRGKNVKIFGTCKADCTEITVAVPELNKTSKSVIRNGCWEAVLPPMTACDKCSVIISSYEKIIEFSNVAVGEVWLAGGQSNMEFELQNEKNGKAELENCDSENVRFYYTPKCEMVDEKLAQAESESKWELPSAENSSNWSAVGYYFAKELSHRLGVTVGVIGCNWGGTSASAWMKRDYLERDIRLNPYIDEYDKAIEGKSKTEMIAEYDEYTAYHAEWSSKMDKCYREQPDIKWDKVLELCGENRYPGPMGCKNPMRPCGLHEVMVSRVCPYTIAGFIYYQGESDDHRPDTYYSLLSSLIENWRTDWSDDSLPFMFVQLPVFSFETDSDTKNWAKLREAQMKIYRNVKNTGIAVTLDCGEFNNIHPIDKYPVGYRLYLQAMHHVYGDSSNTMAFPPIYRGYEVADGKMKLSFDNCDGFELKGDLEGFELAGADGVFYKADAEICGKSIELSSPEVSVPFSARFLWTNYADVTLYGLNGLPVAPFRTHEITE